MASDAGQGIGLMVVAHGLVSVLIQSGQVAEDLYVLIVISYACVAAAVFILTSFTLRVSPNHRHRSSLNLLRVIDILNPSRKHAPAAI
jgi:hypothetical protein